MFADSVYLLCCCRHSHNISQNERVCVCAKGVPNLTSSRVACTSTHLHTHTADTKPRLEKRKTTRMPMFSRWLYVNGKHFGLCNHHRHQSQYDPASCMSSSQVKVSRNMFSGWGRTCNRFFLLVSTLALLGPNLGINRRFWVLKVRWLRFIKFVQMCVRTLSGNFLVKLAANAH